MTGNETLLPLLMLFLFTVFFAAVALDHERFRREQSRRARIVGGRR